VFFVLCYLLNPPLGRAKRGCNSTVQQDQ
jgi:hypothetical protein